MSTINNDDEGPSASDERKFYMRQMSGHDKIEKMVEVGKHSYVNEAMLQACGLARPQLPSPPRKLAAPALKLTHESEKKGT